MIFQISYNWWWNIYLRILVGFTLCWTPSTTLRFGRQHTSKQQSNTFRDFVSFTIELCDDEHYYHYQWHPRDGGHVCRLHEGGRLDICHGRETWSHVRNTKYQNIPLPKKNSRKSVNSIRPILLKLCTRLVFVYICFISGGQEWSTVLRPDSKLDSSYQFCSCVLPIAFLW